MTPFDARVRRAQMTLVAPTLRSLWVRKYFACAPIAWYIFGVITGSSCLVLRPPLRIITSSATRYA